MGAIWKACTHCDANRGVVLAHGIRNIEALAANDALSPEIRRLQSWLRARRIYGCIRAVFVASYVLYL